MVAYTQGVGSGKGSLLGIVTQQSRKSSKSIEEALGKTTFNHTMDLMNWREVAEIATAGSNSKSLIQR